MIWPYQQLTDDCYNVYKSRLAWWSRGWFCPLTAPESFVWSRACITSCWVLLVLPVSEWFSSEISNVLFYFRNITMFSLEIAPSFVWVCMRQIYVCLCLSLYLYLRKAVLCLVLYCSLYCSVLYFFHLFSFFSLSAFTFSFSWLRSKLPQDCPEECVLGGVCFFTTTSSAWTHTPWHDVCKRSTASVVCVQSFHDGHLLWDAWPGPGRSDPFTVIYTEYLENDWKISNIWNS